MNSRGVLQGDDVVVHVLVQVVDHGCQGGGLPGVRWPGHQDQAAPLGKHLFQDLWKTEGVQSGYVFWNETKRCCKAGVFLEDVHPEPCEALQRIGDVDFSGLFESLDLPIREKLIQDETNLFH
jgi:hypothetical protein